MHAQEHIASYPGSGYEAKEHTDTENLQTTLNTSKFTADVESKQHLSMQ